MLEDPDSPPLLSTNYIVCAVEKPLYMEMGLTDLSQSILTSHRHWPNWRPKQIFIGRSPYTKRKDTIFFPPFSASSRLSARLRAAIQIFVHRLWDLWTPRVLCKGRSSCKHTWTLFRTSSLGDSGIHLEDPENTLLIAELLF